MTRSLLRGADTTVPASSLAGNGAGDGAGAREILGSSTVLPGTRQPAHAPEGGMMAVMRIRIDAVDLPGRGDPARGDLHVAVQRRDRPAEVLAPQPGDGPSATWTLECTASTSPTGTEVKGPYVQDRLGRRFIYLSWGTVDESGTFTMFRRAKLMLDVIPADVLAAAARDGLLIGHLGLTDAQGGPLCARVEPPHITWTAARAD